MIDGNSVLAIIPARSGSKGIKNKNIKTFCGLPLIAHTIYQANKSKYIDRVIVSTDSKKIQAISIEYGADAPLLRPKSIAGDSAPIFKTIEHTLEKNHYDIIVLLQPTSPLRLTKDIDQALNDLIDKGALSVVSGCNVKNYQASFTLNRNGFIKDANFLKKLKPNRQDYKTYFTVNGAIYVSYSNSFMKEKSFLSSKTYFKKMPIERSVDIDDIEDWKLAEKLFSINKYE